MGDEKTQSWTLYLSILEGCWPMLEVLKGLLLDMLGELQCWAACQSNASPIISLSSVVCAYPLPLQVRPKKHKGKILCQIQAAGTPSPGPALQTIPLPPVPGVHRSGLSLQGRAIQIRDPGSCQYPPHPKPGRRGAVS